MFRSLLLSEFGAPEPLRTSYWKAHRFSGVVADPFFGGGTPLYEANRLGFHVVGTDVNPMAFWVVRQSLAPLDIEAFRDAAARIARSVERAIGSLYETMCLSCAGTADVKYFLWVKTAPCPACGVANDLFPGHLVAEAVRHPRNVVVCPACGDLGEYDQPPDRKRPAACSRCGSAVVVEGRVRRGRIECRACNAPHAFVPRLEPLAHRLFALEYHCRRCKPSHVGRFFKRPDEADLERVRRAGDALAAAPDLPIPADEIPRGDESDRLHRWGYRRYREMFNERQLLGLGSLLREIREEPGPEVRHALLTVFSDFLRYQNLLCRYDTMALKCQDIFSVHGFPVGLVQCENNVLGIEGVGSGAFRHFVEKYVRAKAYCREPFETSHEGGRKKTIAITGERIEATFVDRFPRGKARQARLLPVPAAAMPLPPRSLAGVFTDPPYYDNVQYAELMDFCFAWLRLGLRDEFPEFARSTTRTADELTGNETMGRGLEHFTEGMSAVFTHYASALARGAPFVFTYHHNEPSAYLPLVVAILDAGLDCTATLPAAAEMSASLHIAGTQSSVLDSVFVCRRAVRKRRSSQLSLPLGVARDCSASLRRDAEAMREAGLRPSSGDLRCLAAGHLARHAINLLRGSWRPKTPLADRMRTAKEMLAQVSMQVAPDRLVREVLTSLEGSDGGADRVHAPPL